jgi:hypothetical protein
VDVLAVGGGDPAQLNWVRRRREAVFERLELLDEAAANAAEA